MYSSLSLEIGLRYSNVHIVFARYGDEASEVTGDAMAAAGNTAQVC